MNRIQPLISPRPLAPVGQREASPHAPHKLKGTIVGVRAGRRGEISETQILTIKIVTPSPEAKRLLHTDVEIIIPRA
ncbi:MAG: hypothetical protein AB7N91_19125 [Candidatus Tectimicrobiota bacterium]